MVRRLAWRPCPGYRGPGFRAFYLWFGLARSFAAIFLLPAHDPADAQRLLDSWTPCRVSVSPFMRLKSLPSP